MCSCLSDKIDFIVTIGNLPWTSQCLHYKITAKNNSKKIHQFHMPIYIRKSTHIIQYINSDQQKEGQLRHMHIIALVELRVLMDRRTKKCLKQWSLLRETLCCLSEGRGGSDTHGEYELDLRWFFWACLPGVFAIELFVQTREPKKTSYGHCVIQQLLHLVSKTAAQQQ